MTDDQFPASDPLADSLALEKAQRMRRSGKRTSPQVTYVHVHQMRECTLLAAYSTPGGIVCWMPRVSRPPAAFANAVKLPREVAHVQERARLLTRAQMDYLKANEDIKDVPSVVTVCRHGIFQIGIDEVVADAKNSIATRKHLRRQRLLPGDPEKLKQQRSEWFKNRRGRARDLAVSAQRTPNMTVRVARGRGESQRGRYFGFHLRTISLTIAHADPMRPRIDLVVGRGEGPLSLSVVTGLPAEVPRAPAAPPDALVLAAIAVGAGVTSIGPGNIGPADRLIAADREDDEVDVLDRFRRRPT